MAQYWIVNSSVSGMSGNRLRKLPLAKINVCFAFDRLELKIEEVGSPHTTNTSCSTTTSQNRLYLRNNPELVLSQEDGLRKRARVNE